MAMNPPTSESQVGQAKPLTEDEAIEKLEREALSEFEATHPGAEQEALSDTGEPKPPSEQESADRSESEKPKPVLPDTITLTEFEARKEQALRDQRAGLEKGYEARLAQERERVRLELVREAEEARLASMTDAERGSIEKEKAARTRLKDEMRPEVQEEIVATLTRELGPQVITALGYPTDPTQWAESTRQAWNEKAANGTFIDRLKFLHEDAILKVQGEKDAEWQKKLDKGLSDQKAQFEASLAETRGASDRAFEPESHIVGEGGAAISLIDLERRYADGTATSEEQRVYQRQLLTMGVFSAR